MEEDEDQFLDDPGPDPAENKERARDGEAKDNVQPLRPGNGAPLAERAGQPDDDPEPQKALFEVEVAGRKITLGSLVKSTTPIEYRYVLSGKSIPDVKGGIIDPYLTSHLLVLDCVVGNIKPEYIRDANQEVEKVILYVTMKPRVVQQALSEAGQVMITEAAKAQAA